jgi:hypothetical protein
MSNLPFCAQQKEGRAPLEITLKLNNIHDLFAPIQVDPFDANFHILSGMERILLFLEADQSLYNRLRATLILPDSVPDTDIRKAEIQAAITRYCDVHISIAHDELRSRQRDTRRSLRIGILLLGISLGLAAAISKTTFMASWLQTLVSNSIGILGTVALWSPVDALLFGSRPLYKEIRLYNTIKHMTFEIQFTTSNQGK